MNRDDKTYNIRIGNFLWCASVPNGKDKCVSTYNAESAVNFRAKEVPRAVGNLLKSHIGNAITVVQSS